MCEAVNAWRAMAGSTCSRNRSFALTNWKLLQMGELLKPTIKDNRLPVKGESTRLDERKQSGVEWGIIRKEAFVSSCKT